MEYIINEIRLNINETENILLEKIANKLKINKNNIKLIKILKKSIDSRKKSDVHYKYNILFSINDNIIFDKNLIKQKPEIPDFIIEKKLLPKNFLKPVIVGCGPSGLFAGLILAKMGLHPIILEQGKCAVERKKDVESFWNGEKLNEKSNVQFGQGGAGTFSDGKMNSSINSPFCNFVLSTFVKYGANPEIEYSNAPHIGTDILLSAIEKMKNEIVELGGSILFEHTFLNFKTKNGKICSAEIENNGNIFEIKTDKLILCLGHSARKTFEILFKNKVNIAQKPFSIGLRIQHKQSEISKSQYGEFAKFLPPADYKLSCFLKNGRCVYTFCNCPGGYVVNASSENNGVVCNGMSYSDRASENSNSAILVSVKTTDFESDHPLAGMYFQAKWEQETYKISGGHFLPIQTLKDFFANKKTTQIGSIKSICKGKAMFADLNKILPKFASEAIKEGLQVFDKKIKGFANPDAILTGIETRSSSPIRIVRDENFETNIKGLFSCGEGAGYAGGIMSSSVDGIKLALKIYE
ncbi:MAG: hypothetical protein PHQ62_01045 [Clostridia bacterium]|nr:hypothetical protein [Clostridia bacterium]